MRAAVQDNKGSLSAHVHRTLEIPVLDLSERIPSAENHAKPSQVLRAYRLHFRMHNLQERLILFIREVKGPPTLPQASRSREESGRSVCLRRLPLLDVIAFWIQSAPKEAHDRQVFRRERRLQVRDLREDSPIRANARDSSRSCAQGAGFARVQTLRKESAVDEQSLGLPQRRSYDVSNVRRHQQEQNSAEIPHSGCAQNASHSGVPVL